MSRPELPKQMLALTADEKMLQLTAGHVFCERFAAPIVVADARHADLVEQQLTEASATPSALILEPIGRNTAPAIAIAAGRGGDVLLVVPSDHVIADVPAFHAAIEAAMPLVTQRWLVIFGIALHASRPTMAGFKSATSCNRRQPVRREARARQGVVDAGNWRSCLERRDLPVPR